jgi:hypothetical protein
LLILGGIVEAHEPTVGDWHCDDESVGVGELALRISRRFEVLGLIFADGDDACLVEQNRRP